MVDILDGLDARHRAAGELGRAHEGGDAVAGLVADADVAHLAGGDDVLQRAQLLVEGHGVVAHERRVVRRGTKERHVPVGPVDLFLCFVVCFVFVFCVVLCCVVFGGVWTKVSCALAH